MADTDVYLSDDSGHQTEDLEAFVVAVISGRMTDAYNRRFGHFGPKGTMGEDPAPQAPTELDDLEPDDSAPTDDWE